MYFGMEKGGRVCIPDHVERRNCLMQFHTAKPKKICHWWNIRMIIKEISNKFEQSPSYCNVQFRSASVAWKEMTVTVFWLSCKKQVCLQTKNSLFPTTETWDINMNFTLMRSFKIFVFCYLANYSMFRVF